MKLKGSEWTEELSRLSASLKLPSPNKHIWKDECAFSFQTPFSKTGLFMNLESFQSFSEHFIGLDHDRTGNNLYLNLKFKYAPSEKTKGKKEEEQETGGKKAMEVDADSSPPVAKLGIGLNDMEGSITKIEKQYRLVIYPNIKEDEMIDLEVEEGNNLRVKLKEQNIEEFSKLKIPELVLSVIMEIISRTDAAKENEMKAWSAEEEEEKSRMVSKFADNLVQLDNGVKISYDSSTWKCAESGMTENLWLNLSDGYIGTAML